MADLIATMIVNIEDLDGVAEWVKAVQPGVWDELGCEMRPCVMALSITSDPETRHPYNWVPVLMFQHSNLNQVPDVMWAGIVDGDMRVVARHRDVKLVSVALTTDDLDVLPPPLKDAVEAFGLYFLRRTNA